MSAEPIRDQIIAYLDDLSDVQAAKVLDFIQAIESSRAEIEYDKDHDPLIGFFSGSPDLGEKSEDILHSEYGLIKPGNAKNE